MLVAQAKLVAHAVDADAGGCWPVRQTRMQVVAE
jgi:hypothetical protein